jgi:hypothetical protein
MEILFLGEKKFKKREQKISIKASSSSSSIKALIERIFAAGFSIVFILNIVVMVHWQFVDTVKNRLEVPCNLHT